MKYNKLIFDTKISIYLRNYVIFYLNVDCDFKFNNIFWVPINVLKLSNYNNSKLFFTQKLIDKEYMDKIYDSDEFITIYNNINKIYNFIEILDSKYQIKSYI
jgi:hypothetical protein